MLTAFGNIETAIATIHDLGAFWFLEKPIQPAALRILLERAASQSRLAEETERLQRQLQYQGCWSTWWALRRRCSRCSRWCGRCAQQGGGAGTGESGTGKELVARAIHHLSPRRGGRVCRHQLRGDARNADGKRAVRPRERRVYRGRGAPGRLFRTGAARHACCWTNWLKCRWERRRSFFACPRRLARTPAGRQERDRRRCACDRVHQQERRRGAAQRRASRGPLLPPERFPISASRCASAKATFLYFARR